MDDLDELSALYSSGRFDEVIRRGELLGPRISNDAQAHNLLGGAYLAQQQPHQAQQCFQTAIQLNPHYADAHCNLSLAFRDLGRGEEAIACLMQAISLRPDDGNTYVVLGSVLIAFGRPTEAANAFKRGIQLKPDHAEAYNRLGAVLHTMGHSNEAMECYRRAMQIKPDFAEAYHNLGLIFQKTGRRRKAVECYRQAVKLKPDYVKARVNKIHQEADICDWTLRVEDAEFIPSLGVTGPSVQPFEMLVHDDNPARNRIRAERYAQHAFGTPPPVPRPPAKKPERLRIGYFSSDFHNHATMCLIARLFEVHDRDRFILHGYSYDAENGDAARDRAIASFDTFHDVLALDDKAVASLARSEAIDIAVDLKGYTQHNRAGIFAQRAAPIQISFLGFPGTTGAPFIDFMVADKVTIPPDQRAHYSESILYLPHSYQVNDDTRQIAERAPSRAELGLPARGFVFCCFNYPFKITPREFDIWMRLLAKVDGSVLWLLATNRWAQDNLKQEARQHGIDPARLVFAPVATPAEHLARCAVADLFLDTFACNAHTTASDALWAGLPVLTNPGQGFVARVAASLLTAVGLPELIVSDEGAYEALALELAENPQKLARIRAKLAANRITSPLFDTARFARNIERGYEQAYDRYFRGDRPADIVIEENGARG